MALMLCALAAGALQSGVSVAQALPVSGATNAAGAAHAGGLAYAGATATRDEETALQALLGESYAVLRSDLFRSNLKSLEELFPAIFVRVDKAADGGFLPRFASVEDLLGMVQVRPPFRYVRTPVALVGDSRFVFALSGIVGDGVHASFSLGRANFAHWLAADRVRRSCAINTAAHELSHLISSDATAFRFDTQPIRDDNAATWSNGKPIASYLVGTAAQCTWLQQNQHSPAVDFKACLQVFGTRAFNALRCTQFSQNRDIKPRADLAPESGAWD